MTVAIEVKPRVYERRTEMRLLSLLLPAGTLLLATTAAAQKPPPDKFAGELKTLSQEYRNAQQAYFAPYTKAKTDEERSKVRLDPAKNPSKKFLPLFMKLGRTAAGTKSGAEAMLVVSQLAASNRDKAAAREAFTTLTTKYRDREEAEQAVAGLRYAAYTLGQDEVTKTLRGIIAEKTASKLKAAALFTLASMLMEDQESSGGEAEARRLFDELKKDYPDSQYAAQAEGATFEIENLQIGKVAPDFEATDEKGVKFKLSDYRGKVVVLDFWGFW
jgi:hypothetical protein